MGPGLARAWVLNLDADDELADPGRATLSRAAEERMRAAQDALGDLVPKGDVVLSAASPGHADGLAGRAFCPTPRALAALAGAGARVPAAPPLTVLRAANHRRFAAELGAFLPGARHVETLADVLATTAEASPSDVWVLKRAFGYAGRGQRRMARGAVTSADLAWIEGSLGTGDGLTVEPWVAKTGDFGLHGFLARDGELTAGSPTLQEIAERGVWQSSQRAAPDELTAKERALLEATLRETANALRALGYFGPFGIDAFRWTNGGESAFNPRCEVNARYSMGWAVGMGDARPDLDDA